MPNPPLSDNQFDEEIDPALPEAGWLDWVQWATRRRQRMRVSGDSMMPALNEGDLVFVDLGAFKSGLPAPGEIIVVDHPYQRDLRLIKRVGHITDDKRVFLVSDNPHTGTDSRAFGAIGRDRVVGRVVGRIVVR